MTGTATLAPVQATVITFPNGVTNSASKACTELPGKTCSTRAYFDTQSLDDQNDETISSTFERELDAWRGLNAANGQWSLNFGGNLNGTFRVTLAAASLTDASPGFCAGNNPAGAICGGLQIRIFVDGMTLPAVGQNQILGWTQGVFGNYQKAEIVAPNYHMDGSSPPDCDNAKKPKCLPMYGFNTLTSISSTHRLSSSGRPALRRSSTRPPIWRSRTTPRTRSPSMTGSHMASRIRSPRPKRRHRRCSL